MAQTTFDHSFGFGSYSHFLNDENHDPNAPQMSEMCFDASSRNPHSVYLHQFNHSPAPMIMTATSSCVPMAPAPLISQSMNLQMHKMSGSPDLAVLGSNSSLCSDGGLNFLAHKNAANLRRFIRLPKAYRWIMSEWFYSHIDRALFLDETDFRQCLRVNFPGLKTRRLTRMQWSQLRHLMGRPRRCSPGFLSEERRTIAEKRERIHILERWVSSMLAPGAQPLVQLPHEYLQLIEMLPVGIKLTPRLLSGTRVIIRLYTPRSGLFLGVIHETEQTQAHYTVWVEEALVHPVVSIPPITNTGGHDSNAFKMRQRCATEFVPELRIVPDTDVLSLHAPDYLISLAQLRECSGISEALIPGSNIVEQRMTMNNQHGHHMPPEQNDQSMLFVSPLKQTMSMQDPVMGSGAGSGPVLVNDMDAFGSYNLKFLVSMAKFKKLLDVKRKCIEELKDMNSEAEKIFSVNEDSISLEFQHNYATLIVQLDKFNKELKQHIDTIAYCTNEEMWRYSIPTTCTAAAITDTSQQQHPSLTETGAPNLSHPNYITLLPPTSVGQPGSSTMLYHPQAHHAAGPISSGHHDPGMIPSGYAAALQQGYYYPTLTPHHQQQQPHLAAQSIYSNYPSAYTMSPDQGMLEQITDWRRRCEDEAIDMINRTKVTQGHQLNNVKNIDLITKLTTMLVQIRNLVETRSGFAEISAVQELLKEVKSMISSTNIQSFENNVEYHVNHILTGLSQYASAMNYNTVNCPTNSMQFM